MTKMLLAEDDDVIKIISPDRSWTRSAARETAESRRDDCPLRSRQRDRGIGRDRIKPCGCKRGRSPPAAAVANAKGEESCGLRSWTGQLQMQRDTPLIRINDVELRLGEELLHSLEI
jgi:hypothetical protein